MAGTYKVVSRSSNILDAIQFGFLSTYRVINGSIRGLFEMINGSISAKHISGPIGIAHAISDVSKNGFISFLSLVGLISTGIGIINLFPLPILDGGHLLLLLYENCLLYTSPSPRDKRQSRMPSSA